MLQPSQPNKQLRPAGIRGVTRGSKLRKEPAADIRSAMADIKLRLSLGHDDAQIAEDLQISTQRYNDLKRELLRQGKDSLYAQTTEDTYLDYKWKQERCVDDLDNVIDRLKLNVINGSSNAMITAIRAKSDIIDRVVKMGQDMGILEKAPERKLILQGVAVATMDNNTLRSHIAEEMTNFAKVVSRYGFQSMDGKPIDVSDIGGNVQEAVARLLPSPQFNENMKPSSAMGGKQKSMAAKASRQAVRRSKVAPTMSSPLG